MISFKKIKKDNLNLIMSWRIKPNITKFMMTDLVFDMQKQNEWFNESVKVYYPPRHWIIRFNGINIGLLSLEEYLENHSTSWGFYLGNENYSFLGGLIPAYFYNYMFFERDKSLSRIIGYLMKDNEKVINLHKFYECSFTSLDKKVKKNSTLYEIMMIEMTRKNWLLQKNRFEKYTARFEH
tara:strand:+ start:629 stop:1171 length:543 start_codon:yes stop_codon:yes gene_type:complete